MSCRQTGASTPATMGIGGRQCFMIPVLPACACWPIRCSTTATVQIMMKAAAEEGIAVRVRRNWLAAALVAFSQGIAFFHAGDDILRSKSLDRDSYNSGVGGGTSSVSPVPTHACCTAVHAHCSP